MRQYSLPIFSLAALTAGLFAPLSAAFAADDAAEAQEDPAAQEELAYAEALMESAMPDFAEPVIVEAAKKWPYLGPKLKVLKIKGDLAMGQFAAVQKIVDGMKDKNADYWAIRLSMADAYYARGNTSACSGIYREFFKAVPNPGKSLKDFYVESGFKWAQMCVLNKNYDEAVAMYDGLLSRISKRNEEERWCMLASEAVDLLLRLATDGGPKRDAYLNKAMGYVKELLWKNELIIIFGRAIAMRAHIEMLRGNIPGAQKLVNTYMKQLAEIHQSLVEQDPQGKKGYVRMSPMPQCRYLLAQLMWQAAQAEAKKPKANEEMIKEAILGAKGAGGKRNGAGAFNHAINVYVKYPESSWAANAGELVENIQKFVLERYKVDLKKATKISPDQMRKVREMQFLHANEAYNENSYAQAVKAYNDILAQFPEFEESLGALSNLADSYIQLWKAEKNPDEKQNLRFSAEAIENQIAERFSYIRKGAYARAAGDKILHLASRENGAGALARSQQLFDIYFHNFPNHYRASQMALSLAEQARQKEDWATAARFYEKIATVYTNSTYYASSLQALSTCCQKMGDQQGQENWLRKFAAAATKTSEKIASRLLLANMQQKRGFETFASIPDNLPEEAAAATNKVAYLGVAGAIKDFRAATTLITTTLETDKAIGAADKERFTLQREQAQFLEGESWLRLRWPADKVPVFRKQAIKAFETYLATNQKGRFAPAILVKLGTIHTADKNTDEAKKAFSRLQQDFPESSEAKNSVPRLARTLIEMGLGAEGVEQYKKMIATPDGKYVATQFLEAGDALLEARSWDVAHDAYAKAIALEGKMTNAAARVFVDSKAMLGQAKACYGRKAWAEADALLDDIIKKFPGKSVLVDAYEMQVKVASEQGRIERDDDVRRKHFNTALDAIKKIRLQRKNAPQYELDILDLRSGDVLVMKMEAEQQMNLADQAKETCGLAVAKFLMLLQAREPNDEHPANKMTAQELEVLERCYSSMLPVMVKMGKEKSDEVLQYGNAYMELFPNGKNKSKVQNAINSAQADK